MKLTVLVFFLALLIPRTHAETPRQFGERFYRAYLRWDIRGAPNTRERHMISAYFGTEVLHLKAIGSGDLISFHGWKKAETNGTNTSNKTKKASITQCAQNNEIWPFFQKQKFVIQAVNKSQHLQANVSFRKQKQTLRFEIERKPGQLAGSSQFMRE